jgi:type II secretory pathway pseudopilin PulG
MGFHTVNCKVGKFNDGYTLAGVLVLIAIMSVMMAIALPFWDRVKQRENEEELIFRGREYVEAIQRYHQKFNSFPPDVDTLLKMKFIRKLYKDPMSEDGEWKILHPDSLVETGEAGEINQPGAKNSLLEDDETKKKKKGKGTSESKDVTPGLRGIKNKKEKSNRPEDDEKSIGPVVGVVSKNTKDSLRVYNGQTTYDKWIFAFIPQQEPQQPQQPGPPQKPGKQPKPGKPGKKPPTTTRPGITPTIPGNDEDQDNN